ncbi:MAG: excinuclease ABC subunit UvrC [Deltaproteobacteria bacterium]|nr:excinuclease ABC subunit UvrC [Deltaproteobacteria bacterium]
MPSLQEQIGDLPQQPGVYMFRDQQGTVLYVGKAKNLRARVRNYFGADDRFNIPFLMNEAVSVEPFLTGNEKEALLLENELIKQHQPRYNIELKDDKHYLCLRVDPHSKYPRVEITRRMRSDKARYFGPYHSATAIRRTVRLINRHFQLRTCRDTVFKNRKRPCLQYEIKRCPAPCVLTIDELAYKQSVQDAIAFLEGKESDLLTRLKMRMLQAASGEDYERAAQVRDQIFAIEESLQKQRVMSADLEDRDVFGVAREGQRAVIQLLTVREGKLRGGRTFDLDDNELPTKELLEDALRSYYDKITAQPRQIPREVLLPFEIEGRAAFEEWLRERRGAAVDVLVPERGAKKKLVTLADNNAAHRLRTRVETDEAAQETLERLQRSLRLTNFPERIECYDISNTQGTEIVASQVVFENGVPAKSEYRLYKMRAAEGQDDFRSLQETLTRRLKRGLEEGELPSLIVIDGGIGQLNVARAVFTDLGVEGVDLCSIAKSRVLGDDQGFQGADAVEDKNPERSPERVFLPGQKNPIVLKPYASELLLLTHLRDEAHRFAITFHRKLRKNRGLESALDGVPGLGPKRKKAILRRFGSLKAFAAAAPEAFKDIAGVPEKVLVEAQRHVLAESAAPAPTKAQDQWEKLQTDLSEPSDN